MLASSASKQAGEEFFALVEITLTSARDLPKMDLNGEADPFCVVRLGEKACHKTQVVLKTRSPVWQEKCRVLVPESERSYPLTIEVWDWDKMSSNDYIGAVTLDLAPYYKLKEYSGSFPIMLQKKKKSVNRGELQLSLHVMFHEDVQLAFWKGIYDFFDVDQSGSITKVELEGMLEGIGSPMTSDDVDELFNKFDTNKDGAVCFAELYDFVSAEKHQGDPLLSKLLPKDRDIIWKAAAQADRQSIGSAVLSNWNAQLEWGGEDKGKRKAAEIMVHDRETGKLVEEKIPSYIKVAMRLMYSTGSGRFAVDSKRVKALLKKMTVSQGKKFNAPASVKDIEPFIQFHDLNRDEMLETEFSCFNDFFFRKLKPTARPVAAPNDPKVAVSPADCRLHVFATITQATQLWIKGANFTLQSLLQDSALAAKYEGGSLVIARLAPQDYHRFHIPVNGVLGSPVPIDGTYYTVNPVAVNETVDVYSNNKRVVTTIDSPEFGLVAFVAVGATMVGSICLTTNEGQQVRKGDEHGYFAFGGSTVLLLFPPNSITFDHDLQVNSSKPIETLVKVGVSIGQATH